MVTQLRYPEYWFYDRRDASTWCDVDSSVSGQKKSRHVPNMGSQVVLFSEQQASEDNSPYSFFHLHGVVLGATIVLTSGFLAAEQLLTCNGKYCCCSLISL
jgi:hypothetical protein